MTRRRPRFTGGLPWTAHWKHVPRELRALRAPVSPAGERRAAASIKDPASLIEHLRRLGIDADRRECPRLLDQFAQAAKERVDSLILNLVDDDPVLRLSAVVAAEYRSPMLDGAAAIAEIFGIRKRIMAIDRSAPDGRWDQIARDARAARFAVAGLPPTYPQSHWLLLLYTLLNRRAGTRSLPTDQRTIVLDAPAAIAIGQALALSQPLTHVPIAVCDHVRARRHYLLAPLNTPMRDVLAHLEAQPNLCVLAGNPLCQNAVPPDAKLGRGELRFHLMARSHAAAPLACTRCDWCVQGCPTRLDPAGLLEAAQLDDLDLARRYGLSGCIECGICSYVCPAHLPLLAAIRRLVGSVNEPTNRRG